MSDSDEISLWERKAVEMLPAPASDFGEFTRKLSAANHGFHRALAKVLGNALNDKLTKINSLDDETKKKTIDGVKELMTELGLAVRCPVTGQPANLYAISPSGHNRTLQYWIRPKNSTKSSITKVDIKELLPLELIETIPSAGVKGFAAKWQRRKNEPNNNAGGIE